MIIRVDQDERGDFYAAATIVAPIHPLDEEWIPGSVTAEVGPNTTLGGALHDMHRDTIGHPDYHAALAPRTRHAFRKNG